MRIVGGGDAAEGHTQIRCGIERLKNVESFLTIKNRHVGG